MCANYNFDCNAGASPETPKDLASDQLVPLGGREAAFAFRIAEHETGFGPVYPSIELD